MSDPQPWKSRNLGREVRGPEDVDAAAREGTPLRRQDYKYVVQYTVEGHVTVVGATGWIHYAMDLVRAARNAGKRHVQIIDINTGKEVEPKQ